MADIVPTPAPARGIADIPGLKQAGVSEVFQPGASTQTIVDFIRKNVKGVPAG